MVEATFQYKKVTPLNRTVAKGIDIIIILIFALILNPVGPMIAIFYSLCSDGFEGKSIGKRLVGLQTFNLVSQKPAGFKESIVRNIPLGIFIFFAIIPIFWIILIIVGIPLLLLEVYLYWTLESGNRIGDILADTTVLQVKESSQHFFASRNEDDTLDVTAKDDKKKKKSILKRKKSQNDADAKEG